MNTLQRILEYVDNNNGVTAGDIAIHVMCEDDPNKMRGIVRSMRRDRLVSTQTVMGCAQHWITLKGRRAISIDR